MPSPPPTRPYVLTLLPAGVEVRVDPDALPYSWEGPPGSVLEIAHGNGVPIDFICAGQCQCTACHVRVVAGADGVNPPGAEERALLADVTGRTPESRLACQVVPDGSADVTVEVPPASLRAPEDV